MQLALVNEKRVEAFPGGKGSCPTCGAQMIAKCGPRIIHHWAHQGRRNCDPWWENETDWHRAWKNLYPVEYREILHVANDGEIHRADVKTPAGIVVEIQHSAMTDAERISRETFYKNLVWVIDGRGFKDNFDIYHMLPDPKSEISSDLIWAKAKRHLNGSNGGMFFRLSEAREYDPEATKATVHGGWIHGIGAIKDEVEQSYNGYHQYDWVRPRKTWLDAGCPVYIDFGDDYLIKLCGHDSSGLRCIRLVSKRKFIHDSMYEERAEDIASRFYPISSVEP